MWLNNVDREKGGGGGMVGNSHLPCLVLAIFKLLEMLDCHLKSIFFFVQ